MKQPQPYVLTFEIIATEAQAWVLYAVLQEAIVDAWIERTTISQRVGVGE